MPTDERKHELDLRQQAREVKHGKQVRGWVVFRVNPNRQLRAPVEVVEVRFLEQNNRVHFAWYPVH
ncbi:hypothetical protein NECAME_05137 [Necator americanus]|uniref:Uncharacterized protein n=1 Tax=Necator americanus TaxID=51031 RepID=W2SLS6_NECAM|nr:hypothetical protein NECAME_05137 [Necator americanus]ETN69682.1 hypothetical protein NECAME_05137 [Necator americanus]